MQWIHVFMACAWFAGWVLLWRVPRLPARPRGEPARATEPLTIVIPARNEARRLPLLLGDLQTWRPDGARVIVVDDQSEDGTAEVAGSYGFVEVVRAPPIEDGWVGKSWACDQGVRRSEPGVLVFLDADVRVHGDGIARAVGVQRRSGGLVTVWPYHDVEKPYEHANALLSIIPVMASGCGSLIPVRKPRASFGPFMVTSTSDLAAVDGHASVREHVIEDFVLARRYADAGLPVTNFGGGRDVSVRMYPDGLRSLLRGWSRNLGPGAFAIAPWRVVLMVIWLTFAIGWTKWGGGLEWPFPRTIGILYAVQMFVLIRQVGRFGILDALLYPLHVALVALVTLWALWLRFVRRRVAWRGRSVPTSTGR